MDKDKPLPAGELSFFIFNSNIVSIRGYIFIDFNLKSRIIRRKCSCVYPGLPEECRPVLERCVKNGHAVMLPDQLTVNQYQSGQGLLL